METTRIITSTMDCCDELGVEDLDRLKRAIYKGTNCGAWICETEEKNGLMVGSIVEGVDSETETFTLTFPFLYPELWEALEEVEAQADQIWKETHGCDACGPEDDMGYRAINPDCKECGGEGAII
jgi:hypothetical protein